jgi:hypothetical protein
MCPARMLIAPVADRRIPFLVYSSVFLAPHADNQTPKVTGRASAHEVCTYSEVGHIHQDKKELERLNAKAGAG